MHLRHLNYLKICKSFNAPVIAYTARDAGQAGRAGKLARCPKMSPNCSLPEANCLFIDRGKYGLLGEKAKGPLAETDRQGEAREK